MDFEPTESQQAVARLAAEVLAPPGSDPWKELAQAGLLALCLPAELGGDECGLVASRPAAKNRDTRTWQGHLANSPARRTPTGTSPPAKTPYA